MGMCLYVSTVSTLNLHKDVNKYIRKGSYYKLYDLHVYNIGDQTVVLDRDISKQIMCHNLAIFSWKQNVYEQYADLV